jgi:hypothetical protein
LRDRCSVADSRRWPFEIPCLAACNHFHNLGCDRRQPSTEHIYGSEIPSLAYVFWAGATLLSSPLPIYFLLKPLALRQRYIASMIIGAIALALWLGIKRITG